MNNAPSIAALQFDQIRINIGKDFYLIQKDGRVRYLEKAMIWRGARSSLALFDPCEQLTNEKNFSPKMIVVTSSPSHVVGQVGKYSLTELATKFVLAIWTLDELLLIMPNVDHERLEKFGFRIGSTTYCVPRWFFYRKQDIQGFISDGWDHASKDALKDCFLTMNTRIKTYRTGCVLSNRMGTMTGRLRDSFPTMLQGWFMTGHE